jgi:hypothetical protein
MVFSTFPDQLRLNINGWTDEPEIARRKAIDLARQALQVGKNDPDAPFVLARFGEDIGSMMTLVDGALALNPSFAHGWIQSGILRLWDPRTR